jgi:putative restriction endonuclease
LENIAAKYFHDFAKLKVSKSHGIAPHKPILLLSVLQLIFNQNILTPQIYLNAELVAQFKSNWSLYVRTSHDCRISYPFYYMRSDKFWKLIPRNRLYDIDQMGALSKSLNKLNEAIECALIADDLFLLAIDTKWNLMLQQVLLDAYFPATKQNSKDPNLFSRQILNGIEDKILLETAQNYRREIEDLKSEHNEEELFLRGSLFKKAVPKIYDYACCISGMRIDAIVSVSMVDACHIVPFSESYNDTISNGIALCPNLHRAFDRGLIAVDNDYRVVVSDAFSEENSTYPIRIFHRKQIALPQNKNYYPAHENFQWHFEKIFKQ